jgi:alkane 1-monooxygenase
MSNAVQTVGLAAAPPLRWRDARRPLWLLGLLVPLLPWIGALLVRATDLRLFYWFGPLFLHLVVPLCDLLIGKDTTNPPEEAVPALEADRYYRLCTFLYLPLQLGVLVWACSIWSRGDLPAIDQLGLALSVGVVTGVGINAAHELGHKREAAERWLAKLALAPSAYGHFHVEHNRGHHARVATLEDPASSRLGESLWAFLPRTVLGSLASAWALEAERRRRAGQPVWGAGNEAPELPSGYGTMLTVALFPPLWRWLMDRRVLAHVGGVARANVQPGCWTGSS